MVKSIRYNFKATWERHKSYIYFKRTHKEFQVGEHVYVKVWPKKSSLTLGSCSKLAPPLFRPFEILARVGIVAYQLALLAHIKIHNVFYMSILNTYIHDPNPITDWNVVQVELEGDLQVEPLQILDRRNITLFNRSIMHFKMQWKHFGFEEAT